MLPLGSDLPQLTGYAFEVRCDDGTLERATAQAEIIQSACGYLSRLLSGVTPEIALIVIGEDLWTSSVPYGMPYFNDDADQIRPGILVMPAGGGDFWSTMVTAIAGTSTEDRDTLRRVYPDGGGGVDLTSFFDLIAVHELAHAFETFGDLRLPTHWLSEIFVNLALHAFVATQMPEHLPTLETLPSVGAANPDLARRMRAEGDSTLEQLQAHYPGGGQPMDGLNYVWYQCRWQRLVADLFDVEGEPALVRLWECFHKRHREVANVSGGEVPSAAALAPLLAADVSPLLGWAIAEWR